MFWMNFEIFMSSPQVIYIYEKGEACIFPKTKFLIFRTFEHNPRKFWVHIYHFYINSQLFSACSLPQHSTPKSQFVFESQFLKKFFQSCVYRIRKIVQQWQIWDSKCLQSTCSWKKIYSLKKKFSLQKLPFEDITKPCKNFQKKFSDLSLLCTSELCLLPFDTLLWFSHFTHAFLIGSSDFQIFSKILICNARDDDLVYLRHIHLKYSLLQDMVYMGAEIEMGSIILW